MPTSTIAETTIELNDEGFFTAPEQWKESMVPELSSHNIERERHERPHHQGLDHHLQWFPRRDLSGPDHGQRPRAEGMEANLLFTFFGLDAVHKARHEHIKLSTVGNPGLHMPTMLGGIPGVSTAVTHYMNHKMEQLDIPSIPEFVEMIADIITVGEFYTKAAGGQIIFT